MQKNYVTRLTAKDRGHAAATIEDSAQHDYAALTLLVPDKPLAPASLRQRREPLLAPPHRAKSTTQCCRAVSVTRCLDCGSILSLFQSKDEPEGIEGQAKRVFVLSGFEIDSC
jgi:hypothetical protein